MGLKKILIIYVSKGGHSARYANWLKSKIDADLCEASRVSEDMLTSYDLLVFGCGVYNEKMAIMPFIKKNLNLIMLKKTVFFVSCWYQNDVFLIKALSAKNLPDELFGRSKVFFLKYGIDKKQLSPADKFTLMREKMIIKKKPDRTNEDIMLLSCIEGYGNYIEEKDVEEVAAYINDGKWRMSANNEMTMKIKEADDKRKEEERIRKENMT